MNFQYKWKNAYSTSPSNIYTDKEELVGSIAKTYGSTLTRLIDSIFFHGKYFVGYEVKDSKGKIKLKSFMDPNLFTKRKYFIEYCHDKKIEKFLLIDKKKFDIVEKTIFECEGTAYGLIKKPFEWAKITVNDKVIAEWQESIKPPFNVKFHLLDESYKDKTLLLIGIFHTYLHAA